MAPRIVIIGGASLQWVPKLFLDIVNTPSLTESEIVLQDINPEPLPAMEDFVRHVNGLKGAGITARSTTDRRNALDGADYVVVCISTGAFESMRYDLEIPERHGIKQSVGDTVGPGGIMRALRNIPVLVDIARDMEDICPDAWMFNITNPMTTLCRAVTRETSVKTVGLCHEVTGAQFTLSQILDVDFRSFDFEVVGVNHLPLITALRIKYPSLLNPDSTNASDRLPTPPNTRDQTAAIDVALLDYFAALPYPFLAIQEYGTSILRSRATSGQEPFPSFPLYLTILDPTLSQQPIPIKNEYWQLTSMLDKMALGTVEKAKKLFKLSSSDSTARQDSKEACKSAGIQGYLGMAVLAAAQSPDDFAANQGNSLLANISNARDL